MIPQPDAMATSVIGDCIALHPLHPLIIQWFIHSNSLYSMSAYAYMENY